MGRADAQDVGNVRRCGDDEDSVDDIVNIFTAPWPNYKSYFSGGVTLPSKPRHVSCIGHPLDAAVPRPSHPLTLSFLSVLTRWKDLRNIQSHSATHIALDALDAWCRGDVDDDDVAVNTTIKRCRRTRTSSTSPQRHGRLLSHTVEHALAAFSTL